MKAESQPHTIAELLKWRGPTELIAATPDQTVASAIQMLRGNGISQLPVIEDGKVVGAIRAGRQMSAFGGMASLVLAGGRDAAYPLCERMRVFAPAESLGGVESLINHPGTDTVLLRRKGGLLGADQSTAVSAW